jgi:hypothetical protein
MKETIEQQIKRLRAEVEGLITEQLLTNAEWSRQQQEAAAKKRKEEAIEYDRLMAQQSVKPS